MSDLVVLSFPSAEAAYRARAEFVSMQKDYLVEMEDVVVVTKSETGDVQLHQAVNMTGMGAAGGALWGTLIGLLFLNPLLGAAVGAGAGALSGSLTDLGIPDEKLRAFGDALQPGGAALAVLLHRMNADRIMDRVAGLGGTVIQTSLPGDIESRLQHLVPPAPAVQALQGTPPVSGGDIYAPPADPGAVIPAANPSPTASPLETAEGAPVPPPPPIRAG